MERKIERTVIGQDTHDGDGVSLKRILSLPHVQQFDPFLMLDSFGTDSTQQGPGFPWHPHRGIITISYMIKGEVAHEDSLGNKGTIGPGGVQWMKAASGIIHTEMPHPGPQGIRGLQFWLNLSAEEKMSDPDYGDIPASEIPVVTPASGVTMAVIAGNQCGITGPVKFSRTEPELYAIELEPRSAVTIPLNPEKNYFVVGIGGLPEIGGKTVAPHSANLLGQGSSVTISSNEASRCFIAGGVPLGEPIAWQGPIAMNSREELALAFRELQDGTFVKVGRS